MQYYSLCFPIINEHTVVLGYKKRGHGEGYLNGFGGKIEKNETPKQAAIRELEEECGLVGYENSIQHVADVDFVFHSENDMDCRIHAYTIRDFSGILLESDEMSPIEIPIDTIQYSHMREEDMIWVPYVLRGKKFHGKFVYERDVNELSWFTVSFAGK